MEISRYRPEDREGVDGLYRRVFGYSATDARKARWEWQYLGNPSLPDGLPLIWLAREGDAVVGQYATMPVRLMVNGAETLGAWGMDVMVAPEMQRKGLGEKLFTTWDRNVGASIGLGLTDSSHALFEKLKWPYIGKLPRLAKPVSQKALQGWAGVSNKLVASMKLRAAQMVASKSPDVMPIRKFDERFNRFWDRIASQFAFVVRRDAGYLNWKYVDVPHVQYSIAAVTKGSEVTGYGVIRHIADEQWRSTILIDFLADPSEPSALNSLLRWVDRAAYDNKSDVIRLFSTHAGYRESFRAFGYYDRTPSLRIVAKINDVQVPETFYTSTDRWHVTNGDSDVDR